VRIAMFQAAYPMRRLIFDVYLHKAMAMSSMATLSSHLFGTQVDVWQDAWLTRLPFGPRLQMLGPWSSLPPGENDAAALDAARHLFAAADWDPGDCVGYRCDVLYPIWRASHMMQFDVARQL
jgi:hypothetical protein